MKSIKDQFTSKTIFDHFEPDPHLEVDQLEVDRISVLSGETSDEDIIVVSYKSSPNLSFYTPEGKLIDVDHYLPDFYKEEDSFGTTDIIGSLKNVGENRLNSKRSYQKLLRETYEAGGGDLAKGLKMVFGLETNRDHVNNFKKALRFEGSDMELRSRLENLYPTFMDLLRAYVLNQQGSLNKYVHITEADNIIITTLNKRSGIAVLIETQDTNGHLLPPNKWQIIRTQNEKELEHVLVFRMEDIKRFFKNSGDETSYQTERYKFYNYVERIEIDSLLDNTDNLLKIDVVNECYQTLASDKDIIVLLSNEQEITIVNTHNSVVPHKWPKKIVLPEECIWMQVDENLTLLFAQTKQQQIIVYDITKDHPEEIDRLGTYEMGFEITQEGNIIAKTLYGKKLTYIKTNTNDIISESSSHNFAKIFSDLSHLFKGESVFTKTQFAVEISEKPKQDEEVIHSAVEIARYDFETNIDSMLAKAESSYETLLEIQNKISIARQNLSDELRTKASLEGVTFVGQRLKKTINTIVRPSEQKVRDMLETLRSEFIMEEMKSIDSRIDKLEDPLEYREILISVRTYEDELAGMSNEIKSEVFSEFKTIQRELNTLFADQISNDDNSLFKFISGEIEQIEKAITETYDLRQLEQLMSTHPGAVELLSMIKQPFILQSFAKDKRFSPVGIQQRLYKAVEARKVALIADEERKEAEKAAAKMQLINMIKESIDYFVKNHTGGFSDIELKKNAAYKQIGKDIVELERSFADLRSAIEMRRRLERLIIERNRVELERMVTFEGKYAYVQNDPNLYVDLDYTSLVFPNWTMNVIEKSVGSYMATYIRDTDKEVYRPTTTDNLRAGRSFEITENEYEVFFKNYDHYNQINDYEFLEALWAICNQENEAEAYPQYQSGQLLDNLPKSEESKKALRCCLEKERRNHQEKTKSRAVPEISPSFIDETPFFQMKMNEFLIKAKLQLVSGSGIILLTGPPSTGKSAFLKFASAIMNREYFEHASDKWQTKNSLVTAIKFGENGPYSVPAGFTKAITTPYSLVNIEEIKEWPEALRKSLNPFFAGSKDFISPDGTRYKIGENILLCAAANLGSMYRQDDEPFTSDFWSRIEVVEYNYAAEEVSREYLNALHTPTKKYLITMQDLVRDYFEIHLAPEKAEEKAAYISQQLVEFMLLPKADEKIKRDNLQNYIQEYYLNETEEPSKNYNPEEAVKVVLKRLTELQGYTPLEFFDFYDHFVNGRSLRNYKLSKLQSTDPQRYKQLKVIFLCIRYTEGCLRKLRSIFYSSAGQSEIEGTNREFIKCMHLLGLMGKL